MADTQAITTIPDEKAAPKEGSHPSYVRVTKNLAKNDELAKKVQAHLKQKLNRFASQSQRESMLTSMKTADAMLRMSKRRKHTEATDNQENTLSNVSSPLFYRAHRIITSAKKSIIFSGTDLPVKYEKNPASLSPDFKNQYEADRVVRERNLILRHYFDVGEWKKKLKKVLHYNNKYGQCLLSMTWERCTEERTERVPKAWDEEGRPTAYKFETKKRVVKDMPEFQSHDIKDCFFDMQIDDMQLQDAILVRFRDPLDFFHAKQRDGEYVNVGKLTEEHLFMGDSVDNQGAEDAEHERKENASENPEEQATGHFRRWVCWAKLPIDPDKGSKRKPGKWDAKKIAPKWFECVFAGDISGDAVCVQLRENPYFHKRNPFKWIHTHEDDKGAFHLGWHTLAETLYEQHRSAINEFHDNKTLRTRAPMVGEKGNVLTRKLKFREGNHIIWVKPGSGKTALTTLNVPDTTGTTIPYLAHVQDQFDMTMNVNDAVAGVPTGGRQTATANENTLQQALKPILEDAEFEADQIFPWLADMSAMLTDQFADPKRTIQITETGVTYEVKPAELYGDFRARVVSVGGFEADLMRRLEETNFIQTFYPIAKEFMGQEGSKEFIKDVITARKYPNAYKYFPESPKFDAERAAWSENQSILHDGDTDFPDQREDHATHLRVHKAYFERYKLLPEEERDEESLEMMELHITMHEQFQESQSLVNQSENIANLEGSPLRGEVQGDIRGGLVGG